MDAETLKWRCLRAKKKLEDVIIKEAEGKDCSQLWLEYHNDIIAHYLDTALIWLQDGHTTYRNAFQHPKTDTVLFQAGTKIVDKLAMVEEMLKSYGVELSDREESRSQAPDVRSVTRKRKDSEDSGIDFDEHHKRHGISLPDHDRGFQINNEPSIFSVSSRPRRARRVRFASASLIGYEHESLDEKDPETAESSGNDAGDTEWHTDDANGDEAQTVFKRNESTAVSARRSTRPLRGVAMFKSPPTSPLAFADTNPTTSKKRRGRPPKLQATERRRGRRGKMSTKSPTKPIAPSGPIWMGRPRPAHMPSIPCPEGLDPVVWGAMSYRSQKSRLEGLLLLAEMPSEESEWESSSDEGE